MLSPFFFFFLSIIIYQGSVKVAASLARLAVLQLFARAQPRVGTKCVGAILGCLLLSHPRRAVRLG